MTPRGITRKIFSGIFFQENKSSARPGFYFGVRQAGQYVVTGQQLKIVAAAQHQQNAMQGTQ